MFEKLHAERLIKLADHLDFGKLYHGKFDYMHLSTVNSCGTVGCALGESTFLWPGEYTGTPGKESTDFFGISKEESRFLFIPSGFSFLTKGGPLNGDASKEMVAAHIRSFVEKKCKELGIRLDGAVLVEREVEDVVLQGAWSA